MKFRNSVKIIQKWIRGTLKLIKAKRSKVNPAVEQVLRDPERVQNSKMIQEILIPIVLRIQRSIRFWIYRRKYLPYLRIKRQRDKNKELQQKIMNKQHKKYEPSIPAECYKLHMWIGFSLNLQAMPQYFIKLSDQASKDLTADDVKSIIKSRSICEDRLEKASDLFKVEILDKMKHLKTRALIDNFYS